MIRNIKKNKWILGAILGLFFLSYAWIYVSTGEVLNAPDEVSNFVFAKTFSQNFSLQYPRAVTDDYLIRPRSVTINQEGNYVPGGFLGIPIIFGGLAAVVGEWSLYIIPAIFAVLGIVSLFGIIKRLLSEEDAFLVAALCLFLPPWWYFASRGYLPNVSMLALLLASIWSFISVEQTYSNKKKSLFLLLSGTCLGLSLAIRPVEIIWVMPLILITIWYSKKRISPKWLILYILPVFMLAGLYVLISAQTYGGVLVSGYDRISEEVVEATPTFLEILQRGLFPFGVDVIGSFRLFWAYTVILLFPYVLIFAIGLPTFFVEKLEHKKYTLLFFSVLFYLVLYYGSWEIADHPDTERISIGVSYMRYWLPIYLLALPVCARGIRWLQNRSKVIATLFFVLIAIWGVGIVYAYQDDTIGELSANVVNYRKLRDKVIDLTEPNAVILSTRNDKLFWPSREVVDMPDQAYDLFFDLTEIASEYSLYWFTSLPEDHLETIDTRYLEPARIQRMHVEDLDEIWSLYKLSPQ